MANRLTRVIGGNNTQTQSFTLDPGLFQYVQSVFVEIDNTAGSETQPTLTVATNNGVALAKKQQGRSMPAGDTGSATWALRVDDESAPSAAGGDYVFVGDFTSVSFGTSFLSPAVPQDAKHLVIFADLIMAGARMQFNGDTTGGHYTTLNNDLIDNTGVLTYAQAISAITNGIDCSCFNGTERSTAVIHIPYYRQASNFARQAHIDALTPPTNNTTNSFANRRRSGFWLVNNSFRPAITSIRISSGSGASGVASLYKIK